VLFILPFLLQVEIVSDRRPETLRIEPAHFQIWLDYSNCMTAKTVTQPSALEKDSPEAQAAIKECRAEVEKGMNAGKYKGIAKNPEDWSRKKVTKTLDQTDRQLVTINERFPNLDRVNARMAEEDLGVRVYAPIEKLYARYVECLQNDYRTDKTRRTPEQRTAGWRKAISMCKDLKGELMVQADIIMARQPDFQDTDTRKAAVSATFDGHDEMILKTAAIDWSKPK
jgi:hypothetical protein